MIGKTLQLLRKNVSVLLVYAIYMLAVALVLIVLYPKDMNSFVTSSPYYFDFAGYIGAMLKILLASVIMFFVSILFFSGYGNMVTEALRQEKTSISSFLPGIKKYFVRVLLASLLMVALAIGVSIVISMILIPLTLIAAFSGVIMGLMVSLIMVILTILAIPFIILWLPSIFMDDVGVIQSMKNGARVGTKNYGKLLLLLFVMYVPALIYVLVDYDTIMQGIIMTPGYCVIYITTAVLSALLLPMLFVLYENSKS